MRVDFVQNYTLRTSSVRGLHSNGLVKVNAGNANHFAASNVVQIAFTGSVPKNMWQIANNTPENNGLGLPEAALGGEGAVGYEIEASMNKHEKIKVKMSDGSVVEKNVDARSFMPFWEHDNPKGGYKFMIHKEAEYPDVKSLPDQMPAKNFYSANPGETLEVVAKKFGLKPSELSYVIQSKPNGSGPDALSKYCRLEPTSVSGTVAHLSPTSLGEVESVSYRLFKISADNPSYNKLKGGQHYFYYTPDLAKASKPYSYDRWGNVPFEAEIINSDGMRALAQIQNKQMNTEEFGFYNPANVFCHDRIAHTYGNHIANMSAAGDESVNGLKAHIVAHNTGRNYQGVTDNAFKYMAVVGDVADAQVLKDLPYFDILQKAQQYGINSEVLSPREKQIAHAIIDPYVANFKDGAGTYNILKAGIASARVNPWNTSTGTVSHTFDREMKSSEMYDAAKFLTDDYADITTKSVLNGSTPANLRLDDPTAGFGRGDNGLTANKDGFTTFKYTGKNIEEVVAAREKNGKWLTNLIWKAGEKGQDELNKLFFNKGQIQDGHNVVGYLSPMKDGDMLVMGWGRPDEQKGFNISVRGYLEFLKREDVSQADKLKVKCIFGGGPWDKNAADFKEIMQCYDEICKLEGGIYKHNLMVVDGYFPNRLVGCSTHGLFTSRREMCGITPLEAKTAAVPYGATKTGGPVDYTNSSNGFLTKNPVEENPEKFGLDWTNSPEEIDAARVRRASSEVSDVYKAMLDEYSGDRGSYISKCKKNVEELIDWHNNAEYNFGKSANRRYLEDIFEVDRGWDSRNKNPLQRLVGAFGEFKEEAESVIGAASKSKPMKIIITIAGCLAVASGAYYLIKGRGQNAAKAQSPDSNLSKEIPAEAEIEKTPETKAETPVSVSSKVVEGNSFDTNLLKNIKLKSNQQDEHKLNTAA